MYLYVFYHYQSQFPRPSSELWGQRGILIGPTRQQLQACGWEEYRKLYFDLIWSHLISFGTPCMYIRAFSAPAVSQRTNTTCLHRIDNHHKPALKNYLGWTLTTNLFCKINNFWVFIPAFSFYICLLYSSYIACNLNCTITANLLCKRTRLISCVINQMCFFPSLLWTCMLSIEYHFNNKGFWIFYLKAEEERCSKFAKRSRSVVIYQKMLNSAVFQNSAEFCDP